MIDVCILSTSLKLTNIAEKGVKKFKGKLQICEHLANYIKNLRKESI